MGNQNSTPVYDDGQSSIDRNDYYVLGDLRSGAIKANVINCERIYVDRLKAHKVQLCGQAQVSPPTYQPFPAQRNIKIDDVLTVRGSIFAGSVKCDKLNAYDVFYVEDLNIGKTEVKDRNSVNEHLIVSGQGAAPSGDQYYHQQPAAGGQQWQQPQHQQPFTAPILPPTPAPSYPQSQQLKGNFTVSSHSVSLDHKFYLLAQCSDIQGQHHFSALDLNDHIANNDGHLHWASGNFAGSCRNIRLEGDGKVLVAEARRCDGSWSESHLWLDERIGNENGELTLVP